MDLVAGLIPIWNITRPSPKPGLDAPFVPSLNLKDSEQYKISIKMVPGGNDD